MSEASATFAPRRSRRARSRSWTMWRGMEGCGGSKLNAFIHFWALAHYSRATSPVIGSFAAVRAGRQVSKCF